MASYSRQRVDMLLEALRAGLSREGAAAIARLPMDVFWAWYADPERKVGSSTFADEVDAAEAELERRCVATICDLRDGTLGESQVPAHAFKAAVYLLERRRPLQWGGEPAEAPVQGAHRERMFDDEQLASMSPDQLAAVVRARYPLDEGAS